MSRQERTTDIKVGATVLVGLLLLGFGVLWAKNWSFGTPDSTVKASFTSAGGLEVGDPVTINGVKRGAVRSVELRQGDVLVEMSFDREPDLRRDAAATIMMFELMGGKKVELLAGNAPEKLPEGTVIRGSYSGDIGTLVAMVSGLANTVESITGKADTLLTSLNVFFAGSGGADGMRGDVQALLREGRGTLANADRTLGALREVIAENRTALRRTLTQADELTAALNSTLGENREGIRTFIDSSTRTMTAAGGTLRRADALLGSLDSLVNSKDERTLIYRLTRDKAFANRLDSTLISIYKLSEQLRLQGLDANVRFFNSSTPLP